MYLNKSLCSKYVINPKKKQKRIFGTIITYKHISGSIMHISNKRNKIKIHCKKLNLIEIITDLQIIPLEWLIMLLVHT